MKAAVLRFLTTGNRREGDDRRAGWRPRIIEEVGVPRGRQT
jgi:hypothetical protein